jgi:hypothetical protein
LFDHQASNPEFHTMLIRIRATVVLLLAFAPASVALGQIFTDNMSSGVNWTIVLDADSSFEFGYDYSLKGVPSAPNGSDTIGLKFEVNNNAPAEVDQIGAFNSNASYTGQYTLRVDIWSNWAPVGGGVGTGTTEFVGVSVGHDGFAPGPFGATLIYTGDGDTSADYRLYKDAALQAPASGQYALGTTANANNSSNAVIQAAFPSVDIATAVPTQGTSGTVNAGAAGFQWMTVNVEVDTDSIGPAGVTTNPGFARFSMRSATSGNTLEIGTIDNSNGGATTVFSDTIGLLMSDLFSSVTTNPTFSFSIFDNVQVFEGLVPLPSDGLAGDFNGDDSVDAADYTVWRDKLGTNFDLNGNGDEMGGSVGIVDQADYALWKSQFGQGTLGVGATAGSTAVPEPTTASGFLVLLLSLVATLRRTLL